MTQHTTPKLTIKPLVSVPCWRKRGDYLTKESGTAWFLFGWLPVWHTWDKHK